MNGKDWTVVIDPGHGGDDPGAMNGARREDEDVFELAMDLTTYLPDVAIVVTRRRGQTLSLSDRAKFANIYDPNTTVFVSLHRNASNNKKARGMWIIYDDATTTEKGIELARCVQEELREQEFLCDVVVPDGTPYVDGRQLTVLSKTKCPAILIEAGFITNEADNLEFDTDAEAMPKAIAAGIMRYIEAQPTVAPEDWIVQEDAELISIHGRIANLETLLKDHSRMLNELRAIVTGLERR